MIQNNQECWGYQRQVKKLGKREYGIDIKWLTLNTHKINAFTKANKFLGFLRRNLKSTILDLHQETHQREVDKVQKPTAKLATSRSKSEMESITSILNILGWRTLPQRRTESRLMFLYKEIKDRFNIPTKHIIIEIEFKGIWHLIFYMQVWHLFFTNLHKTKITYLKFKFPYKKLTKCSKQSEDIFWRNEI